jgi:hypothetical protein
MDLEKMHVALAWVAKLYGMGEVRRLLALWFPPAKVAKLAPPSTEEAADDDAIYWARTRAQVSGVVLAYRSSKGRRWEAMAKLAILRSGATV